MAHTPGPWTVESDGTSVSMGGQVVIVAPAPDGASQEEMRANARLIAAAPALLAALRELRVAYFESGWIPGGEAAYVRAVNVLADASEGE